MYKKPLCDLLDCLEPKVILVTLDGLENILKVGKQIEVQSGTPNPFAINIEEAEGLDKIEKLQEHENTDIYKKAYGIIDKYFSDEGEEDSNVAPAINNNGAFSFGIGTQPQGGFNF